MKKTFLLLVALLSFAVGVFAVSLSPPKSVQKQCVKQSNSEKQLAAQINLDQNQDKKMVQNKLIETQNTKALTVSAQKEIPAEFDTNKLTAKTADKTFDLPPILGIKVFNGNIANQIRAQPV